MAQIPKEEVDLINSIFHGGKYCDSLDDVIFGYDCENRLFKKIRTIFGTFNYTFFERYDSRLVMILDLNTNTYVFGVDRSPDDNKHPLEFDEMTRWIPEQEYLISEANRKFRRNFKRRVTPNGY